MVIGFETHLKVNLGFIMWLNESFIQQFSASVDQIQLFLEYNDSCFIDLLQRKSIYYSCFINYYE